LRRSHLPAVDDKELRDKSERVYRKAKSGNKCRQMAGMASNQILVDGLGCFQ
jgi:hypothetical protein